MNFLTTPEVRKELGSDTNAGRMGHSHALILQSWLGYDADMACWERERSSRYAGSVITRADAELFGLSFPRFAIRVYLDDQQTSFMNLRRTNLFASRAEILMTHLSNGEENLETRLVRREEGRALHPIIGDCVLRIPPSLVADYQFVHCDVSQLYGSEKLNLTDVRATPYVNYCDFYGSCALAVAFMSTGILSDYCSRLYGLTEMPFLLGDGEGRTAVVGALDIAQLCTLMSDSRIGLRAYHQRAPDPCHVWSSHGLNRIDMFTLAAKSYLSSSMPIMLPTDVLRLHGIGDPFFDPEIHTEYSSMAPKGIYRNEDNKDCGFEVFGDLARDGTEEHFLLMVGTHRHEDKFIVHDAYGLPYLSATAEELMLAAPYKDETHKPIEEGYFIPVTPGAVLLPFFTGIGGGDESTSIGLLSIVAVIQPMLNGLCGGDLGGDQYLRNSYRLINLAELNSQRTQSALTGIDGTVNNVSVTDKLRSYAEKNVAKWVWVQWTGRYLIIYDAEKRGDPNKLNSDDSQLNAETLKREFFLGVIDMNVTGEEPSEKPERIVMCDQQGSQEVVTSGALCSVLKPCLISSFCVTGLFAGARNGIDPLNHYFENPSMDMELYTFMPSDLRHLMEMANRGGRLRNVYRDELSVVDNLAALAQEGPEWRKLLASTLDSLLTRGAQKVKIGGFATFIPGATSFAHERRKRARAALIVLSSLAAELKQLGHPVDFIEIVGGSKVSGIRPVDGEDASCGVEVSLEDRKSVQSKLYTFLDGVGTGCGYAGVYALELEPGTIYAYNNLDDLAHGVDFFRTMIDKGVRIGYNIDIAHWAIAGIAPQDVSDEVLSLVSHCHICDSSTGHTDDSMLLSLWQRDAYKEWFELLKRRTRLRVDHVPFSKYVSIELECAKSQQDVIGSITALNDMLGL